VNPNDANVVLIEAVSKALDRLNERVVYLGGGAVGLLITDPARPAVRATVDVDVIVEVASRADYYALANDLRQAGFAEDPEAGVLCRWRRGNLKLDVMPTDPAILGFSNAWLQPAVDTAQHIVLPSKRPIRVVTAPFLLATKLEAFYDRGNGDFLASHDLEDIVNLIDGRPELLAEVDASTPELRVYLREEFEALLANEGFTQALPGQLGPAAADQSRLELLIERLRRIAGL
jgi:predicted nucleotidyltransferase